MASDRRKILRAINAEARQIKDPHARRVFRRAAVQTGLVESNLSNPSGGSEDSAGWRQERASLYADPTNIRHAARRFRQEFQQQYQPGEKSYDVAAQVQRPAAQYRGRYKERAAEAEQILKGQPNTNEGTGTIPASYKTVPGVDNSQQRQSLKLAYLENRHDPDALLALASGLQSAQDGPDRQVKVKGSSPRQPSSDSGGKPASGVSSFEGKQVAAWIKPALVYARKNGWKGQINSGYRSKADQTRIYNSGVRPAAKPGTSNHEFTQYPGGAIDVSDAETLAQILQGSKYGKRLKWAGKKDPVHFSHPHGGSY